MATNNIDPAKMSAGTGEVIPAQVGEAAGVEDLVRLDRLGLAIKPSDIVVHSGYVNRHLDCWCTPRQAAAAKMGAELLANVAARFEGGPTSHPAGSIVQKHNDLVRWLLDRLADDLEAATGKKLEHDFGLEFRT